MRKDGDFMSIELAVVISVIGCVIGVLSFFRGGKKDSASEGEKWGELKATLDYIKVDISEIKKTIQKQDDSLEKHISENLISFKELDNRINRHLREDHKNTS